MPARRRSAARRRLSRPSTVLVEQVARVGDIEVFYRESRQPQSGAGRGDERVMLHLHGFGMSGAYLVPTAERLAGEFHTLVPDLPGFGRSGNPAGRLDVTDLAESATAFLDEMGVEKVTMVGNSMGCAVITELAHLHPERVDRVVLVSPAGGVHNQPLRRAVRQLAHDGIREPRGLVPVAVPDYVRFGVPSTVRLFQALTQYPSLDRMLDLRIPTLGVIGSRDPLMPSRARLSEVAARSENHALLVVIEGAAHAVNFSHPDELAHAIRQFMADEPITDDPDSPGVARAYEIHRGARLPPVSRPTSDPR